MHAGEKVQFAKTRPVFFVLRGEPFEARSYLPEVPCGLLALPGLPGAWARSFGFAFGKYGALHPNLADVTREQIQRVHRLKGRVHVWTVNPEVDIHRLCTWGVDGIFTDDPQLAVRVRGDKK